MPLITIGKDTIDSETYDGAFALAFRASWEEMSEENPDDAIWLWNCCCGYIIAVNKMIKENKDDKARVMVLLEDMYRAKGRYSESILQWFNQEGHYLKPHFCEIEEEGDTEEDRQYAQEAKKERQDKQELTLLIKKQPKLIELMGDLQQYVKNQQ